MADLSFIRPFSMLRATDSDSAGGKGASLGELEAAAVPVPPGFVVLACAWQHFVETANLGARLAFLLDDVARGLDPTEVSRKACAAIEEHEMPAEIAVQVLAQLDGMRLGRVAVRSSATAEDGASTAWAGQLDTFLDVTRATLLDRVRACWASLFTPRALVYRREHGLLEQSISVAVAVQKMIDADVAGVGFSVHPTTQEPDLMLIQASYGLGEAVLSGAVTPDTWVVSKSKQAIVGRAIGHKTRALRPTPGGEPQWKPVLHNVDEPCLTDAQVLGYARILETVEEHYGRPVDTEWTMRDGRLYVVQARHITTLDPDYACDFYDEARAWAPMHRRPWNLLSSSMFSRVMDRTCATFGLPPMPTLLIEVKPGLVQVCHVRAALAQLGSAVLEACRETPARVRAMLERGLEIEAEVEKWSSAGVNPFATLEEAVEQMGEAMTCATQLPFVVCEVLSGAPSPFGGVRAGEAGTLADLLALARRDRTGSAYPWYTETVLPALAAPRVAGIADALDRLTIEELLSDPVPLDRLNEREGQFVFERAEGRERVTFHPSTGFLLARLNDARVPRRGGDDKVLHGSSAYPGVVEGRAAVVLGPHDPLEAGDILVTVNANPSMMPLLSRCSALVTDEGGASCHAAIVARELKKPCVIGTGDATSRIANGARIRVDALDQTVTLL